MYLYYSIPKSSHRFLAMSWLSCMLKCGTLAPNNFPDLISFTNMTDADAPLLSCLHSSTYTEPSLPKRTSYSPVSG